MKSSDGTLRPLDFVIGVEVTWFFALPYDRTMSDMLRGKRAIFTKYIQP